MPDLYTKTPFSLAAKLLQVEHKRLVNLHEALLHTEVRSMDDFCSAVRACLKNNLFTRRKFAEIFNTHETEIRATEGGGITQICKKTENWIVLKDLAIQKLKQDIKDIELELQENAYA